jgi:hypothetical protein
MVFRAKILCMSASTPPTSSGILRSPAVKHRRQMLWQVWVPLGASILFVMATALLVVAAAVAGSEQIARWGNISAIWVITPVLIALLIFLAITSAGIYGLYWLLERMPDWMLKSQLMMVQVSLVMRRSADIVARPIMEVNGWKARLTVLWKQLFNTR